MVFQCSKQWIIKIKLLTPRCRCRFTNTDKSSCNKEEEEEEEEVVVVVEEDDDEEEEKKK